MTTDVWEHRQAAFHNEVTNFATWLGSQTVARKTSLQNAIGGLRDFEEYVFNYFQNGFFSGSNYTLAVTANCSPDLVRDAILEQAAFDFQVIKEAVNQRGAQASTASKTTLDVTDRLATAALSYLMPGHTAVTYFQRSPCIRVVPYTKVALIGVPYGAINTPMDWMTIPHEVGHYVHRHLQMQNGQALWRAAERWYDPKISHWLSEIYADIFAAQIAGPLSAYTMQTILRYVSSTNFVTDDGAHPTPIIRPFVYHKTLIGLGFSGTVVDAISTYWEAVWKPLAGCNWPENDAEGNPLNELMWNTESVDGGKPVDGLITEYTRLNWNYTQPDWAAKWKYYANAAGFDSLSITEACAADEPVKDFIDGITAATSGYSIVDLSATIDATLWTTRWPLPASGAVVMHPEWMSLLQTEGWASKGLDWGDNAPRPKARLSNI